MAAYGFNEGSGAFLGDLSGNGNNGTIIGATWTNSGKYGNALSFNGTNALVTVNNSAALQLTSAMTLEAWVFPTTVNSAWRDVIYKGDDNYYLMAMSSNSSHPVAGAILGGVYAEAIGPNALTLNTWAHLAATYDGATVRLYVNGVQVASRAQTGAIVTSANPLQIGGDSIYGQYFAGRIDEARIYNRALSVTEIQSDMNTPLIAPPDGQPPSAPGNLVATALGVNQVHLSWTASTDNVGVAGYLVERHPGSQSFVQVGTNTGTSYDDAGLAAGSSYSYRVRATDAAQNLSQYSGVASVTMQAGPAAGDNFNRADGGLGVNWVNLPEGGVTIASGQVVGTHSGSSSGSYRIDGSYNNDQYSEITVTSSPLSIWVAPTVRAQSSGNLYAGFYYNNAGTYTLLIYKRVGGSWVQLGNSYVIGSTPLAAGTKLRLVVSGTTLAFMQNGAERLTATDSDISSGAPGIVIGSNTDTLDDWSGGNVDFEVHYISTDGNGVESYDVFSVDNAYGPHELRVLRPNSPGSGVAHNFLYVLPVEPEGGTFSGDGLTTLQELNAHNQYNVTLVAPSFPIDPWYADHPTDPNIKYESFMSLELQPWVTANLASTGSEQHWLLGFSKSGFGGIDLLLKNPSLFTLGAFWDFPAQGFTAFDQFGSSSASNYGTDANFQANYRLTNAFLDAHKTPFLTSNRIFISGYVLYQTEVAGLDAVLTSKGMLHTYPTPVLGSGHTWDGGWVPQAVSGLYQNSIHLGNP